MDLLSYMYYRDKKDKELETWVEKLFHISSGMLIIDVSGPQIGGPRQL